MLDLGSPQKQNPANFETIGITDLRHLISLGYRCDVAFQLRMHGKENISHFFDWLSTPLDGVIKIIEADFNVFHPDDLVLATDEKPHYVKDQVTGVHFYHQFPLYAGHVQPDFLLHYDAFIKKFRYLAERFRQYASSKPVTLVRQGAGMTAAAVEPLETAVLRLFPGADIRFLYLLKNGEAFQTPHGRALPMKPTSGSLGDPAAWAALLLNEKLTRSTYRHATVQILGSAHDDHNLAAQNRFREPQLQEAIAANRKSPHFRLELATSYLLKGQFDKAEQLALEALKLAPKMPEAIFLATHAQKQGRKIDAKAAAEVFVRLADGEAPEGMWVLEAAAALLEAGEPDAALRYINKALAMLPLNHRAYFIKAKCLMAQRRFPAAERAIDRAMGVGWFPAVYLHFKARILMPMGRLEEAIQAEQRAIEMGSKFLSLFNLAQLLLRTGRREEALAAYQTALPFAGTETARVRAQIDTLLAENPRQTAEPVA